MVGWGRAHQACQSQPGDQMRRPAYRRLDLPIGSRVRDRPSRLRSVQKALWIDAVGAG